MELKFNGTVLEITREASDPKYYGTINAASESKLLYAIKKKLNGMGFDLIKKRMWKDGHLVSDMQQYLRAKKATGCKDKDIALYNMSWAIDGLNDRFNAGGCKLGIIFGIFDAKDYQAI